MKHVRLLGPCLVAILLLSAAVAASASAAEENPTWRMCEEGKGAGEKWKNNTCTEMSSLGKYEIIELKSGHETRRMEAEANGTQTFTIGSLPAIECKKLKLNEEAEILGGEPGTSDETIE